MARQRQGSREQAGHGDKRQRELPQERNDDEVYPSTGQPEEEQQAGEAEEPGGQDEPGTRRRGIEREQDER
ncbi:MAG TPA: hypothetical protein VJS66_04070 [Burkholderiales bacterium]|nr:hypothetical protein [Burkholderiales bacterium]